MQRRLTYVGQWKVKCWDFQRVKMFPPHMKKKHTKTRGKNSTIAFSMVNSHSLKMM